MLDFLRDVMEIGAFLTQLSCASFVICYISICILFWKLSLTVVFHPQNNTNTDSKNHKMLAGLDCSRLPLALRPGSMLTSHVENSGAHIGRTHGKYWCCRETWDGER